MLQKIKTFAPGRINIIGEHTDYNDGFVLPAAIDKKTIVEISRNGSTSECRIWADNLDDVYEFDMKNYTPIGGGWQNYVMGVVSELEKKGAKIEGFEARFLGDIPIGSGMSSSAALECAFAFGLNELFDLGFDKWELIKVSQMAEHHFVGIKCGIMDQFASMMGKKNQVMRLDCRSLEFEYFPLNLGDYQLLLLNTKVSHSLADSAYNERRSQCEKGVSFIQEKYPNIINLRDVNSEMLLEFFDTMPEIIYKRCKHIVNENQRVLDAAKALKAGEILKLGALMYASHTSLEKDFEVSCKELDFLVEKTKGENLILGSRMMGGGFGGCTINIIKKDYVEKYIEKISNDYKKKFGINLEAYEVSIEDGAGLIKD